MKILPSKSVPARVTHGSEAPKKVVKPKQTHLSEQPKRLKMFDLVVRMPKEPPRPPPSQTFQMLDSVRFKCAIPGTDFKKGMVGTVMDVFGTPSRFAAVEITDPPYVKGVDVEALELVRRYGGQNE